MRKLRIDNSQLTMIVVLLFTFSIVNFPLSIPAVLAADSTPSASIKTKLEELKKEIASKAANLKQEVNKKLQNKAFVGFVKSKSDKTITIASSNGAKIISVNQDTIYETKSKKSKYSLKSLSEEDYIAALGDVDEIGSLVAKKLVLLPDPGKDSKAITWGQVVSMGENLVIKTKTDKNITVTINSNTEFKKGGQDLNFNDVKLNDFVIVVGNTDNPSVLKSVFIYVIPQGGFIKAKKVATPSASPKTATSSAKKTTH